MDINIESMQLDQINVKPKIYQSPIDTNNAWSRVGWHVIVNNT